MKISINDQEVELVTCGHCNAIPTEADAQNALKRELGMSENRVCSICRQKIKLTEMKLTHHYYSGEHRWLIDGKYEEVVEVRHYSQSGSIEATMHFACFKRVVPGMTFTPR